MQQVGGMILDQSPEVPAHNISVALAGMKHCAAELADLHLRVKHSKPKDDDELGRFKMELTILRALGFQHGRIAQQETRTMQAIKELNRPKRGLRSKPAQEA